LDSAIGELLENVQKHNQHKEIVTIAIQTYVEDNYFYVVIADDGVGISACITNSLRGPYERVNPTIGSVYAMPVRPSNLLNIRSHVLKMDGTLEVHSAKDFLTKITLKLPLSMGTKKTASKTKKLHHVSIPRSSSIIKKNEFPTTSLNTIDFSHNSNNYAVASIAECVSEYQRDVLQEKVVCGQASVKFVEQFTQVLEEHFDDDSINLEFVANEMLLTERTLARRLNKHYKLGFAIILRKFRLQKARDLLIDGEKVTHVAFNTGFNSASYFTQCFKSEFGFTPSLLLKQS
jgi:AraC-like DNA-binding protein